MQVSPFPGQTDHDIELTFGSAKAQIIYKIDTNGFLEFIRGANITVRTNLLGIKINKCNQTLNIISLISEA